MSNIQQLLNYFPYQEIIFPKGEDTFNEGCFNFSIDSRNLQKGDVFIALKAARDGHDFLQDAISKGAQAVIVERKQDECAVPQLVVNNSQECMWEYARNVRENYRGEVIAITGSSGKTTTKAMFHTVLSAFSKVHASKSSFNNALGVPLTLAQIEGSDYAVVELGANHIGEIDALANLVEPHIGVITNIGNAHIGEFGGYDQIIQAKSELLDHTSVCAYLHSSAPTSVQTKFSPSVKFGKNSDYSYTATSINSAVMHVAGCDYKLSWELYGLHNFDNACAVLAYCHLNGLDVNIAIQQLSKMHAIQGRSRVIQYSNISILDDSYNANPKSMQAAIQTLGELTGKKFAIVGEMMELGADSASEHFKIGKLLAQNSVQHCWFVGEQTESLAEGFGMRPGTSYSRMKTYDSQIVDEIVQVLQQETASLTLLVKGSNSNNLQNLVSLLEDKLGAQHV